MSFCWLRVRVKIAVFLNFHLWFHSLCRLEGFLSLSRCPQSVAILSGRCFKNCWLLRPGHVRKFPLFIVFRKVLVVGLKQHPRRYLISSIFVLSVVIISIARCLTGLDMGMFHRPYVLFLFPFKISVLPIRIIIYFLSKLSTQSS